MKKFLNGLISFAVFCFLFLVFIHIHTNGVNKIESENTLFIFTGACVFLYQLMKDRVDDEEIQQADKKHNELIDEIKLLKREINEIKDK